MGLVVGVLGSLPRIFDGSKDYVQDISFAHLNEEVFNSPNISTSPTYVVLLYGNFCPHCRVFGPMYVDVARALRVPSVTEFVAIDAHKPENMEAVRYFGARFVPLLLIMRPVQDAGGYWSMGYTEEPIGPITTLTERLRTRLGHLSGTTFTPPNDVITTQLVASTLTPHTNSLDASTATQGPSTLPVVFSPDAARQDAATYLAIMLNIEVFRGDVIALFRAEMEPLLLLLDTCIQTMLDEELVSDCEYLRTVLMRNVSTGISMNEWFGLLNNTKHLNPQIASSPVFRSCTSSGCAFWRLLHVVSLGKGGNIQLTPAEGMSRIRSIVDHFFSCQHCREHFLEGYDSCQFGRCEIRPAHLT